MSETEEFTPEEVPQTETPENAGKLRQLLEEQANQLKTQTAKVQQLERKEAIIDAGLTLNADQIEALSLVHKGEWTPESIKETASKLGIGATQASAEEEPAISPEEQAELQRQGALTSAGGAPDLNAELEATFEGWTDPKMTEAAFKNSVENTFGPDFFENHRRNLLNK